MTIEHRVPMGGVFDVIEDAWNATGGRIFGLAADVFEGLPIYPPLRDLVEGPMRDFARTTAGKIVFRALATSLTGGTAAWLGPQLATIWWTVPGLARGEDFVTAWTAEFAHRVEQTAQLAGGEAGRQLAKLAAEQVPIALKELERQYQIGQWVGEQSKALARSLGISEWAAETARSMWNETKPPRWVDYDPVTGARKASAGAIESFDPSNLQTAVSGVAATALALTKARTSVQNAQTSVSGTAAKALAPSPLTSVQNAQTSVAGTAARALASAGPDVRGGGGAPAASSKAPMVIAVSLLAIAAGGLAYAATRKGKRR